MPKSKTRKKSKYRSLMIDKKRYYFYRLTWLDILGDTGHADTEEFLQMKPAKMVSYGYVFEKTKEYIKTFASYDSKEGCFSDRNVFPAGCVIKLERINL
jgi:hypothetical protein